MHIRRIAFLGLAAAALAVAALPVQAAYLRVHAVPSDMTYIDQGKPDANFSGKNFCKILVNYVDGELSGGGVTAGLLHLPDALLSADPANLARATLVFNVIKSTNFPAGFTPRLYPLAAPYSFGEATWNNTSTNTLENHADGIYRDNAQTLSFDLLPLLTDPDAAAALAANGALLRLDYDELPDTEAPSFTMLNLHNTQADDANLPDAYFVFGSANVAAAADFGVSYIDSKPKKGDDRAVFWEQGSSTVGKVLLNGQDGSECRAIVSMPAALSSLDPALVKSVVADFALHGSWNDEICWLLPIDSPTSLELRTVDAESNTNCPTHGPSWAAADTDVATAESLAAWSRPNVSYTNNSFEIGVFDAENFVGPWSSNPAHCVAGKVEGKRETFDLTPLWRDPEARALLSANGAIVVMDPANWDNTIAENLMPRINLYCPDSADSRFEITRLDSPIPAADAVSDVATVYYIDAKTPDATEFNDDVRFIINEDATKGDTRVLLALPDLDLPTVESLGTLHFGADLRWKGNPEIPVLANVLTVPFGTTEDTCASWNRADHSTPETAWEGGTFSEAFSANAVFGEASVDFDLSGLLASELRDTAFANGLLLRWDDSKREDLNEGSFVKHTLFRENPAPTLSWTQRPVVHSYIDSTKPDSKNGWSGAQNAKCIVLLNQMNDDGSFRGETRALVKFAPSFFHYDPAQHTSLILSFPYGRTFCAQTESMRPIALQPLASPFRMDQATWNNATDHAPWTTPGGDLDDSFSIVATDDSAAKTLTFDLTPIYANPDALAHLIENGAVLRMLGDLPEDGDNGYNFGKAASGPVAVAIAADGVEFRGISFDYPAEAEPAAKDAAPSPTCTLSLTGLDPTADYAVYSCSDLAAGEWTWLCDVPDDGQVTFPASGSISFFRVQPRE